jgi:tRNA pseudouridine13 synthase
MLSSSELSPHVPPLRTSHLPGVSGTIGQDPEDFQVDEVPLYPPSGAGNHLYVRIRKREVNSHDAIQVIARAAGIRAADIGSAGMKDRRAVTTQWISLAARESAPVDSWSLPSNIEVLEHTRHSNKLRTGHLLGNRFSIRLVGVNDDSPAHAESILRELERRGLANYFGHQRFGRGGANLARAKHWAEQGGKITRFQRKLYPSVLQAEVFNRYATARLAEGAERPQVGDVVRLCGNRSVFVVTDPDEDAARMARRDIVLTGPIFGPKARRATGHPGELEDAALDFLGASAIERMSKMADGTRRDLLIYPEEARIQPEATGLRVEFFLPRGSYATELIRELTRAEFSAESRFGETTSD